MEDQPGDDDHGADEDRQEDDLTRRPVRGLRVVGAEPARREGAGPDPRADAEPAEEHLDGEGDGHRGNGLRAETGQPEDVDEIVKRHHQHRRDGGQAHFPEKGTDGFVAKVEL